MSETLIGGEVQAGAEAIPAPAVNQQQTSDSGSWLDSIPEDSRGFVENKGWQGPADVLASYRQLEGYLGADKAGRGVVLPKDDQDVEAFDNIYKALGRPEKPDEYGLKELLANDPSVDSEFMGAMSGAMHGAGLSKRQAESLAKNYHDHFTARQAAAIDQHQGEVESFRQSASPETIEMAQRGFRFLEIDPGDAMAIEMHFGVEKAAKMFARIGQALGGDKFPAGASDPGFTGSPSAAQAKIDELMADKTFSQRYINGEASAYKIMENLFKRVAEG